jgi:diguanylate cyclase (GGDEF)-like protein
MRKGRFSGLSDTGLPGAAPSLAELLLFDFRRPAGEDDARVAADRARALRVAVPFVAASHIVWAATLLAASSGRAGPGALAAIAAMLAPVLLADLALWAALRRERLRPQARLRLTLCHVLLTSALWAAAASFAASAGLDNSTLVRASLLAGVGAGIAAFFTIPALLLLSCAATLATMLLIDSPRPLLGIAAGLGLFLASLGLLRARDLILSARARLALEGEAKKARRFVADFEESGRGWFWETNADGILTYVSPQLGSALAAGLDGPVGRRFEDVLLLDPAEGEERRSLDFHLSARFPFTDVVVRAPGSREIWWSLSGHPNFDEYGRFLGFRGMGANLSEQRRSEAETSKLARHDGLTGLPNRTMMRATLDEALANAAERRQGCALMMIDLDRFKQVNDTLGHPTGDKLLKKVARRLVEVIGGEGRVGRLGGDEFEAILPGSGEEGQLARLAARLIEAVSKPYRVDGHEITIGTSVGIAVARPGKAYAEGLIRDADLALYAAKADGRGTFRFFAPEMHAEAADRQILAADLREALSKGQLKLVYQPIVLSVSEEVAAFEALLRWHHPTRGVVPPATLVPLAEEGGLMAAIGDWVLRTACAEAAKWPAHIRVAVNLSPLQVADPALPATVAATLARSGLDAERLELEITEGAFLADGDAAAPRLARLKALGVRIVLDNFGTGPCGLGHLREAPLDKIKIDRSFVRGAAAAGSRNAAIVRAIVVLAESLGMDTTAEGAETLDELALIRRLGCSQVQGFIFSNPVTAEEALKLAVGSRPSAEVIGFSRPPRHRLIRMGKLRWDGGSIPVRLRNISEGGAMIECPRTFAAGARVALDLDEAGSLDGEIRWCQRGQIGLMFDRPFRLGKLARRRRAGAAVAMLQPAYLQAGPEPPAEPGPSPLARKRGRR